MKKTLLLFASAALLLVGCAKEQLSNGAGPQGGELTEVTFTASLDNSVATKAAVDGDGNAASVNRCIMEIYYGDELFTRMYSVVDANKKASFVTQLVSNRTYTVAFWADHVEQTTEAGLQIDNYYDTRSANGLKAVALKGTYAGNIDARDAFALCKEYTIAQAGSAFTAVLRRPFAQINVITTDVATVAKVSNLKPEQVNVVLKNATKVYNVLDSTAVAGSVADLTYTANIYNWDATKTECTLSMDYIFAEKEKGTIDIDWKAKKAGDADVEHAFATIPYQRNYRTNIKGKLLTTQGQWTVEVDPIWANPDHEVEYVSALNIADGNSKMQSGAHYVNILEPDDAETVNVQIPNTEGDDQDYGVVITGTPAGESKTVNVEDLGEKNGTLGLAGPNTSNFVIDCPYLTVKLNGEEQKTYNNVTSTTAESTLYIEKNVKITNCLTIKKGNTYIYGNVANVTLDPAQGAMAKVSEWHVYDAAQFAKAIAVKTPLIVLEADIELEDAGVFTTGTTTLDLNGHVLSCKTTGGTVAERGVIIVNGGTLNIEDNAEGGKISGTSNGANNHAVTVNGGTCNLNSGTLKSDYAGVYVLGGDTAGTFTMYDGVINAIYGVSVQYAGARFNMFNGTINAKIGVTGNGSAGRGGTVIQLNKGTINGGNEAEDAGIYHPQSGTLYLVDDIVIKGSTALEMKSGTEVYYSGNPSLEATNAVVSHNPNGNGISTTGYAIAFVNNPGYSGNASTQIKSGMHYGPVAILDDDEDPLNNTAIMKISGGIFSVKPDDSYLVAGYAVIDNTDSQTKARYPYAIGQNKWVGTGTEADPYQLATAADLKKIMNYGKTTHFILTQDLELTSSDCTTSTSFGERAITGYLYGTLDGGGHKITFPDDDEFYTIACYTRGGTIQNLDIEFKQDGTVTTRNYDGATFKNVNVSGKLLSFTGNQGAYVVYNWDRLTVEDCTCSADITGIGGDTDYNGVFVGNQNNDGLPVIFRNCKYTGKMSCGRSSMFLGNLQGAVVDLTVENCSNDGTMISTHASPSYKMNYYFSHPSNNSKFTLNGELKQGGAYNQDWIPACVDDNLVATNGSAINGPIDCGMGITKNDDNHFVITPAAGGIIDGVTVDKYTVYTGLYVGLSHISGSGRFFVTEVITPNGSASYTTTMKDLKFVDDAFVNGGTIETVDGNRIFTKDDVPYYVVDSDYSTGGQPKAATIHYVAAYDAQGRLLASVSME